MLSCDVVEAFCTSKSCRCTYRALDHKDVSLFSSWSRLAWDGERLALAGFIQGRMDQESGTRQPMGFGAAVWTGEGLQYAGFYEYVPARDWENWMEGYYRHLFDGRVEEAAFRP